MSNEDVLMGFPTQQYVPLLIKIIKETPNFDVMLNACRNLAFLMEALPRSTRNVAEAIPVLLQKVCKNHKLIRYPVYFYST